MTTLKDVADHANVSMANAYHVLTGATDIDNETRAAVLESVGALWFYALDAPMTGTINVDDDTIIDSSYEAVHFTGKRITNITLNHVNIIGVGTFVVQIQASGSATFNAVTVSGPRAPGQYSCQGANFQIIDGGGNTGWDVKPYCGIWPTPNYAG